MMLLLPWFRKSLKRPTCHCGLSGFSVVHSDRFALGYSYICERCRAYPRYIREDLVNDKWITMHIICWCGNSYKHPKMKHIYNKIFKDWDTEKEPRFKWFTL